MLYSSYVLWPKAIIASLAIWDQMSKDVADPLRADEKFVIPNLSLTYRHFVPKHPSHSWFWSGSDRIDAEEHCVTYLLPQILSGFLMEVDEFYTGSWFPIVQISRYCAGWNQEKYTEYTEYWIHDGADPRSPLCEDETATRGYESSALQPHQKITLGSNITLCSVLELFCFMQCYQVL